MAGRVGFITHGGKQLYLIDIEGLTPEQVIGVIPTVAKDIRGQPPKSALSLLNVKGVKLNADMNEKLKQLAAGNAPHVKASAIVGLAPLQKVVLTMVAMFSRREFKLFDTVDQAKAYLVGLP